MTVCFELFAWASPAWLIVLRERRARLMMQLRLAVALRKSCVCILIALASNFAK